MPLVFVGVALLLVYWVNLYNFMDGIDGIAGIEAVFLLLAPLGLALIGSPASAASPFFWWPIAVAVAVLVFLLFNWQPAKIFMGDVGSTFLGFVIAAFALLEVAAGWLSPWEALILAACFVTDGTLTLLRRLLRGEAILVAHRRHAYQQLARLTASHRRVVILVAAVNLVWLLPLAVAAHVWPAAAPGFVLLVYVPLALLAFAAGAGGPEHG